MTNPSRFFEKHAITFIRSWVGARGTVFDTSSGGGPDFRIDYIDGTRCIGEIGWHEDPVHREAWEAVHKSPDSQIIPLPQGCGRWSLGLLREANIKRLRKELPTFISRLSANNITDIDLEMIWPYGEFEEQAKRLGIEYISRHSDRDGDHVMFFLPGDGGAVPSDGNLIVPWIEGVLVSDDYKDSWQKLDRHEATLGTSFDEKHVFIIAGSRTEFGVSTLLRRVGNNLPTLDPKLPSGVTHIWILSDIKGANPIIWCENQGWTLVGLSGK